MKPLLSLGALFVVAAATLTPAISAPVMNADSLHRADVRDLGRAAARMPVSFSVVLRYRHDAELTRLVNAQNNPDSPMFRHWLTSKQFNDYFAASPQSYARVASALSRAGFNVSTIPNRSIIKATGSSALAERYFKTQVHRVMQAGYGERYASLRPTVPSEIAGDTTAVIGLDNIHAMTTDHHFTNDPGFSRNDLSPDKIKKGPLKGPSGGYGPWAIVTAYDYPVQHKADGTGHAVAIAIDYDTSDTDLTAFTTYFNVKRTGNVIHVPVDGGQPYSPSGSVESTLDVETAASYAPGADVYVYNFGAAFTFQEISDAYAQTVSDNFADEVSSSFGGCEDTAPQSFIDGANAITKQGNALGIGFNASTGDHGRGGKCTNGTGQDVPASMDYFVSVGGADPTIDDNGNLTSQHEDSGSGGGPSDIFPLPKYQQGLAGVFSTTNRNLPDVSGPYLPDAFYLNGHWSTIGGTSWASPATGAFLVEAAQVNGKRLGFANPALYKAFKKKAYGVFTDVTVGNNKIACGVGYDDCSGIGTLLGEALAKAL